MKAENKGVEPGAKVVHEGDPFIVTGVRDGVVTFESERYRVHCAASDLVYDEKDGALFLPGRREAKDEKAGR